MRVIVAMLIAGAGCSSTSTHRSTLSPYVRDLRSAPGGVEAISCELVYRKTQKTSWSWLRFDTERDVETAIEEGACWRVVLATEVTP
jgi:hypothetical protein